jgi:hypothetical protein
LRSSAAVLSFTVAFGIAKCLTNLAAGALTQRWERRWLLVAGWAVALPVPLIVALAPSWDWIIAANVLLGVNQGLAWSMTALMKIDLVGPRKRAWPSGSTSPPATEPSRSPQASAAGWRPHSPPRDVLTVGGAAIASTAFLVAAILVRDTSAHVALEQARERSRADDPAPALRRAFALATYCDPALRACSQAGLVNNLNDALAWGLVNRRICWRQRLTGGGPVAVKLHPMPSAFAKTKGHPCWKVQKALDEAGIDYEIVKEPALRWRRADYEKRTGTKLLPAIEFEDGTSLREESNELVAPNQAGPARNARPPTPRGDQRVTTHSRLR